MKKEKYYIDRIGPRCYVVIDLASGGKASLSTFKTRSDAQAGVQRLEKRDEQYRLQAISELRFVYGVED